MNVLGLVSWPQQMSGKIWVDVDEFTTAGLVALVLHGYANRDNRKNSRLDPKLIREMFGELRP